MVRGIWEQCYLWINISTALPVIPEQHFWQHFLFKVPQSANTKWRTILAAVTCIIWNWRSNIVFRNLSFQFDKVINDILFHSWSWIRTSEEYFDYSFVQCQIVPGMIYILLIYMFIVDHLSMIKEGYHLLDRRRWFGGVFRRLVTDL